MSHCEKTLGARAPINSILKIRYQVKRNEKPFGVNLEAITQEYIRRVNSGESSYIISVSDERVEDISRASCDEVGVSIIFCNLDLLKHSIKRPYYGCDGTFNVVPKISCEGLDFELNTIISRDLKTGKCFSVMRQLASRKTKAARKDLFKHFVDLLLSNGLKNPLLCEKKDRMSFTTDFVTTYAISLCEIMADRFSPDDAMVNQRDKLIQAICFGCNVHAHRSIQTKVDRAVDPKLYSWAINTRMAEHALEVEGILQEFETKGDNWRSFAKWFRSNICAKILWFTPCYKDPFWSGNYEGVFMETNGNESANERLKGSSEYLLTRGKGLDIISLVNHLEKEDALDAKNILIPSGLQYMGSTKRKTSAARTKKRKRIETIVLDDGGPEVTASEPKRAKTRK